MKWTLLLLLIPSLLRAQTGCEQCTHPTPTASPSPTSTFTPTPTPTPPNTPTPTSTPTPTPTPTAPSGLVAAVNAWAVAHPGAPFIAVVGNSVMEGYPNYLSRRESGCPCGNIEADVTQRVYEDSSNIVVGTNDGKSGAKMSYIYLTAHNTSLTPPPKYLIVEGGINDMSGPAHSTFADEQTYFDSMKTDCASHGSIMVVEEVMPSGLTTNANIVAWNSALATWASSNSVTLIATHDWMGDPAASPAYSTLLAAYDNGDHTHLSIAGVGRHADKVYATLVLLNP